MLVRCLNCGQLMSDKEWVWHWHMETMFESWVQLIKD